MIPGNAGEGGTTAQLQELATGLRWSGMRYWERLWLQDPFQRVRGGEGCRWPVGNSSSSACSAMHFMGGATGTTKDKHWR